MTHPSLIFTVQLLYLFFSSIPLLGSALVFSNWSLFSYLFSSTSLPCFCFFLLFLFSCQACLVHFSVLFCSVLSLFSCLICLYYWIPLLMSVLFLPMTLFIGTTHKGIGPAYSSKTMRNGIRVGDLRDMAFFETRLRGLVKQLEGEGWRKGESGR